MYILENPVMQRELVVNLRMARGFILLFVYQALLGVVVYFAWPQDTRLDLSANSESTKQTRDLVDMFFIGQFVVASMMAPSFAAGSITGEKERKTYEMLLARSVHRQSSWGSLSLRSPISPSWFSAPCPS
jgi:ABC-type transport system involved in multi-copper enzyme maturation permease subunit